MCLYLSKSCTLSFQIAQLRMDGALLGANRLQWPQGSPCHSFPLGAAFLSIARRKTWTWKSARLGINLETCFFSPLAVSDLHCFLGCETLKCHPVCFPSDLTVPHAPCLCLPLVLPDSEQERKLRMQRVTSDTVLRNSEKKIQNNNNKIRDLTLKWTSGRGRIDLWSPCAQAQMNTPTHAYVHMHIPHKQVAIKLVNKLKWSKGLNRHFHCQGQSTSHTFLRMGVYIKERKR